MTTKTEEDGTVSSFATLKVQNIMIMIMVIKLMIMVTIIMIMMIKVEVGGDAQRVRAERRAVGDQLGERRSQWRVSFVIDNHH